MSIWRKLFGGDSGTSPSPPKTVAPSSPNQPRPPVVAVVSDNLALLIAAAQGDEAGVKKLIAAGADVNAKRPNDGATALMLAAQDSHTLVVKMLLDHGADVNAVAPNGSTALNIAVIDGHLDVVMVLLEKGAKVDAAPPNGATALTVAAYHGHLDVVKALLEKGANVNAKRTSGATALIIAAERGHVDVVKELLANGADVNAKKSTDGATALFAAEYFKHTEIIHLLKAAGAGPSSEVQQVKNRIATHPDYEAIKKGLANFGGSGLSGDEVIDTIASVVAQNKKEMGDKQAPVEPAPAPPLKAVPITLASPPAPSEGDASHEVHKLAPSPQNQPVPRSFAELHKKIYGELTPPEWFNPSAWSVAARSPRPKFVPTGPLREKAALIVEAQYYIISEIAQGGEIILDAITKQEEERKRVANDFKLMRESLLGTPGRLSAREHYPFDSSFDGLGVRSYEEDKRKWADKATGLFRSLGHAAAELGMSPEQFVQLGGVFGHAVIMMFRRLNQEELAPGVKVEISMVYDALWREVGQSFSPSDLDDHWIESHFDVKVPEEKREAIRSMGLEAIRLVRLGMSLEDIIEFGLIFRNRTQRPVSTLEKRAIITQSIDIAVPLLGQSPHATVLANLKKDLEAVS